MKIHHNIIAAIILGLSIIIAGLCGVVAIKNYCQAPQQGRYTYREKNEDLFVETLVFDTATGTSYSQLSSTTRPTIWTVQTIDDIKHAAQLRLSSHK